MSSRWRFIGYSGFPTYFKILSSTTFSSANLSISAWYSRTSLSDIFMAKAGRDSGTNGALALWWHPIKEITAGIQYRYAIYKLGLNDNANAAIFSLKYNF